MIERPDRALIAWGAALRADKSRRHRIAWWSVCCAALGAALIATLALPPLPRLVWNASTSMPLGLYHVSPGSPLRVGDLVIARAPSADRALAAQRRYVPANVPLVKRVAAVAGQRICWQGFRVTIDGHFAVRRRALDRRGRVLPWWGSCHVLPRHALLLLAPAAPDSFDGRYFGPTSPDEVIGRAVPLWLR